MIDMNKTTPKILRVTVAPYYDTPVTENNYEFLKYQAEDVFLKNAKDIQDVLGLTANQLLTNIGCYTFRDKEGLNCTIQELSYTFEFNAVEGKKVEWFACLMAEFGFQQQESAIAIYYTDNPEQANAIEVSLNIPDVDVFDSSKNDNVADYSYCVDNHNISFVITDMTPTDTLQKVHLWTLDMDCKVGNQKTSFCKLSFFDSKNRMDYYRQWMETETDQPLILRCLVENAYNKSRFFNEHKMAS